MTGVEGESPSAADDSPEVEIAVGSGQPEEGDAQALSSTPTWHIAPWVHMPRLEAVVGCRLVDLNWDTLQALIADSTPEDLSLDYKAVPWTSDEEGRFELGKDIAAFANASGGLIVVGISEVSHLPNDFSKFSPTDSDARSIRETVTSRVAPFVPEIEIGLVSSPSGKLGCLLILVPPSDQAPHAVLMTSKRPDMPKVDSLSIPVREGTQTRWLREPDLASRYRERFTSTVDLSERVSKVFDDGLAGVRRLGDVWLAVALAPSRTAAGRPLSLALRDEFIRNVGGGSVYPQHRFSSQPAFGRGRVVLTDGYDLATKSLDHRLELYTDGSAFAALAMRSGVPREVRDNRIAMPPGKPYAASATSATEWLIRLLYMCAHHAVFAGASGDFQVMAQLAPALEDHDNPDGTEREPRPDAERGTDPLVLTEPYGTGSGAARLVPGSIPLLSTTPAMMVATPSLVSSKRDLITSCAQLTNEIFAEFGQLPSESVLFADGSVSEVATRLPGLDNLRWWAREYDLFSDEGS